MGLLAGGASEGYPILGFTVRYSVDNRAKKRTLITMVRTALLIAFAILAVSATRAPTAHAFGRKADVRTRIGQQVDKALKIVKASKDQRAQVQLAMAEVLRLADDMFGGPHGMMPELDEVLAIFAGDQVDERAVQSVKTRRDARHHRLAEALERAFHKVHAALSSEQRNKLADHARGQVTGPHMRAFKEKVIDGFVNAQVEDVLDQLGASQAERQAAHQARDRVLDAIRALRGSRSASVEELASIFRGDPLDKAALSQFRSVQEDHLRVLGELFGSALTELHDALTPAHRKQVVELVRARQARRESGAGDTPL